MIKKILITGATSGIGLESVRKLASLKHHIIMTGLDINQAEMICEDIKSNSGNTNIKVMHLDLSSVESIKLFVSKLLNEKDKIDVLINNAGCFNEKRIETIDGLEMTMGVNYFGTVLFTELLIDKEILNDESRIINLVSKAAFYGKINVNDINFKKKYQGFKAYSASKLALILYSLKLNDRLKDSTIKVYNAHPGKVKTNIFNGDTFMMKVVSKVMEKSMISSAEGAETSVFLATSDEIMNYSGNLFHKNQVINYKKDCLDEALVKSIWKITKDFISNNK